ncbi:MAG: energy-coupling factor transporter transmembrane component T family protein [Canibacter sp.]
MTSDVLGAYIPGDSVLHRLRPGTKLLTLFFGATLAMVFRSLPSAAIALTIAFLACIIAGIGSRRVWGTLLRFLIVAGVLFVFHAFQHGPVDAFAVVGTLIALLLTANVLTATTRVEDTLDTITWALHPLQRFGVNPDRVALTFSLVLRMIPELLTLANQTRDAARARGLERNLRARLTPLMLRTVARAELTGEALAARGITDVDPDSPGILEE